MLYYDVLDEIAALHVPNKIHPELHINSRQAWVDTVAMMIEYDLISTSYANLCKCAEIWEAMLYKRYSVLN